MSIYQSFLNIIFFYFTVIIKLSILVSHGIQVLYIGISLVKLLKLLNL